MPVRRSSAMNQSPPLRIGYAGNHDCRVNCTRCDQQTAKGAGRRSPGCGVWGTRLTDVLPARKLLDGDAQFAHICQDFADDIVDACGPRSPGLSPGGLGPHRTSSGSPRRAFLRFPVCPPGSSPSSAFLWFPFVRRSPVRSLRPSPGSGSPSVSLRDPFPVRNLHGSAAAGRFRRRWSPGGRDQGHQQCRAPLARSRSARTSDGQRPGTMGYRRRIACYGRPHLCSANRLCNARWNA